MKKVLCLVLALVLALGMFAGCTPSDTKEIIMITDIGDIDDESFNQGTWTGVKDWATKNNKTFDYIKPASSSAADLTAAVDLAVAGGAKVIVTPGFVFAAPIFAAQDKYPNVSFVVLDSDINDGGKFPNIVAKTSKNAASFTYTAENSGFLAGYAAVQEGYTKLGYLGGVGYPTVNCFGFGFAQGAEYAAKELGIKSIDMKWGYTGDFSDTPANTAKATAIFSTGTEVLFSVGGANSKSCFKAAGEGKWVITPDTDGTKLSEKVMTSALKELGKTVEVALDDLYNNKGAKYFGKHNVLSVEDKMVGLASFENSRYTNKKFTKELYDAVYAKLVSGEIKVVAGTGDESIEKTAEGIQKYASLSIVKVSLVK